MVSQPPLTQRIFVFLWFWTPVEGSHPTGLRSRFAEQAHPDLDTCGMNWPSPRAFWSSSLATNIATKIPNTNSFVSILFDSPPPTLRVLDLPIHYGCYYNTDLWIAIISQEEYEANNSRSYFIIEKLDTAKFSWSRLWPCIVNPVFWIEKFKSWERWNYKFILSHCVSPHADIKFYFEPV